MKYDFDTPVDRSGSDSVKWAKGEVRTDGAACIKGSVITVEDLTLPPPALGWNSVWVSIRNLTDQRQTCVVNVEMIGSFWFQGRTRVFYYEIGPLACETFEAGYSCSSSARGKARVSVSVLAESHVVEQSSEGEPFGLSGVSFLYLKRGPIEIYAQKGGYAEVNAERVLSQRSAAIIRICSFLGVPPTETTLVLYEKAEEKTFDTGHLGVGWARGNLAVEVFNATSRLAPYHEMVHVQANALGRPPAFLCEGLAVYLEEEFGGSALKAFGPYPTKDQGAKALRNIFWPLDTLLAFTDIGPADSRPEVSYPQAASVVKYLVATFGRERLMEAYRRLQNANEKAAVEENRRLFREIFGATLKKVEDAWLLSLHG